MKRLFLTVLILMSFVMTGMTADTPKNPPKNATKEPAKNATKEPAKNATKEPAKNATKESAKTVASTDWLQNDDIIFIHYPGNCQAFAKLGSLTESKEWKEFSKHFHSKLEESRQQLLEKHEKLKDIDHWLQEKIRHALKKDNITTQDIINLWYQHVRVTAMTINGNPDLRKSFSITNAFNESLSFVIDFNPTPEKKIQDIILNDLKIKVVYKQENAYVIELPNLKNKGHFFVGVTPLEKSSLYGVITGIDKDFVINRVQSEQKNSQLLKIANTKGEKYSSATLNVTFFKKLTGLANSLMSKTNADICNDICSNIEKISFSVEKGKDTGLVLRAHIHVTAEESADEIDDLLSGALALVKLQGKKKEDSMGKNEKFIFTTIKGIKINRDKKDITAEIQISREMFDSIFKDVLVNGMKKIKDKAAKKIKDKISDKIKDKILN